VLESWNLRPHTTPTGLHLLLNRPQVILLNMKLYVPNFIVINVGLFCGRNVYAPLYRRLKPNPSGIRRWPLAERKTNV